MRDKYIKSKKLKIIIILVFVISLVGCTQEDKVQNEAPDKKVQDNINHLNKVLKIENLEIENIKSDLETKSIPQTKIQNISNSDISKITLVYEELDKNKNIIATSKNFIDITLNPQKIIHAQFSVQEYTKALNIIGYEYIEGENKVYVDLKEDKYNSQINNMKMEDSKQYEILSVSDPKKVSESKEGFTYKMKVKNLSLNDLGNITLKLVELNDNGEYMRITHATTSNVLKANEETEIEIVSLKDATSIKLVGYIYDDVNEKANIDIDVQAHKAKINK